MLLGLPALTAVLWWAGLFLVASRHPQGGGGSEYQLLAVIAAIPALIATGWSLRLDASPAHRISRVAMVAVVTAIALALGLVILFLVAAANCPPHAYECPI